MGMRLVASRLTQVRTSRRPWLGARTTRAARSLPGPDYFAAGPDRSGARVNNIVIGSVASTACGSFGGM